MEKLPLLITRTTIKKLANTGDLCKIYVKSFYNKKDNNTVTIVTKYVLSKNPISPVKKYKGMYLNKENVCLNSDTLKYIAHLSFNHSNELKDFSLTH